MRLWKADERVRLLMEVAAVCGGVDTLPFPSIGAPKFKHRRSEGWKKMRGRCH